MMVRGAPEGEARGRPNQPGSVEARALHSRRDTAAHSCRGVGGLQLHAAART
jgi:hypothetical protein